MTSRFRPVPLGAVALATLLGCVARVRPGADASAPRAAAADTLGAHAWRPMPCASCASARIVVETRRSTSASGGAGRHAFARVRNLNPYAVALTVSFMPDYYANPEGIVPAELWPLQLAASGGERAEQVVRLRRPWAREAAVHDVERF